MKLSLAISHTPWNPERVDALSRLYTMLGCKPVIGGDDVLAYTAPPGFATFHLETSRAANHEWSATMWTWAAAQDVEWCVFLQDDAIVGAPYADEDSWSVAVEDCIHAAPADCSVIGLQAPHPAGIEIARAGYGGYTTCDGLIGVGYAVRRRDLRAFLEWRADSLADGALEAITEDTLIGLWCAVTGRRIFHPLPTVVDHDTTLASTFGNDAHVNRRSLVRWDSEIETPDGAREGVPHLGRFYAVTPELAKRWVKEFSLEAHRALIADNGQREQRRLHYVRRARMGDKPMARVFIATPMKGAVEANYAASVWRILRDEELDAESNLEIVDIQQSTADVVRVRSRLVSYFLNQTDATHLFFLDGDVELMPKVLRGMIAADRDFVACPYPKRDRVDFERARSSPQDMPAEAAAYRYSVHLLNGGVSPDASGCAEVAMMPLGAALLKREALEAFSREYESSLGFDDAPWGPSVALFQLICSDRRLLSEDFSFCERWRKGGRKLWMYLGDGAPANHHGAHCYAGHIEAFGFQRGGT